MMVPIDAAEGNKSEPIRSEENLCEQVKRIGYRYLDRAKKVNVLPDLDQEDIVLRIYGGYSGESPLIYYAPVFADRESGDRFCLAPDGTIHQFQEKKPGEYELSLGSKATGIDGQKYPLFQNLSRLLTGTEKAKSGEMTWVGEERRPFWVYFVPIKISPRTDNRILREIVDKLSSRLRETSPLA